MRGLYMTLAAVLWWPGTLAGQALTERVTDELRSRLEASTVATRLEVDGEPLYATVALGAFYARRAYAPAWLDEDGPLAASEELIETLRAAHREGLNPLDYHLQQIEALRSEILAGQLRGQAVDASAAAGLDLLLSDAFLIYGSHLLSGRVNPETIHSEWIANRRGADFAVVLESAMETGGPGAALRRLLPPQAGYARLRSALAIYRFLEAQGGWPSVPAGPSLELGDGGERVTAIRRRLAAEGAIQATEAAEILYAGGSDVFDEGLDSAVRRFQARHGLTPDGVVGDATLAAMNVSIEDRIEQIELNLERWRWLPDQLGDRYVLVNIPAYSLDVIESDSAVLSMQAIVGRSYRRTPVFSDTITYLVLNPYWYVPHDLAVLDKLPLIKKDPGYLASQKIRVYSGWSAGAQEIDPRTVDWQTVTGRNFKYRLIQEPGPQNALGRVKFMFPNRFNVYLHDTPGRELFSKAQRAFSSGCIRVEKPMALTELLLADPVRWSRSAIEAALARQVEQSVTLSRRMPVHLLYWTAWANDDGSISFRPDIYNRDGPLKAALEAGAPDA